MTSLIVVKYAKLLIVFTLCSFCDQQRDVDADVAEAAEEEEEEEEAVGVEEAASLRSGFQLPS